MASGFGKRRAEIMSFLSGLSDREKLVVLTYLCNDARISARIPDLARTVLDMQHAYHGMELLKIADTERSNVDLEFLARRKGCRLERIEGAGDRWKILRAEGRNLHHGACPTTLHGLTRGQALEMLRSLPDPS